MNHSVFLHEFQSLKSSYYIINSITWYRLLAAPILVYLAFKDQLTIFKWMVAFSFFTDSIDGFLSRRYKVTSVLGARVDSIADDLTVIASLVGLVIFFPGFIERHLHWVIVLASLVTVQMTMALIKYKKLTSFHTYGAKIAAVFQGVFFIISFFAGEPVMTLFYAAVIITGLEIIEEIILVLLLPSWKTNVKGIYWVKKH